VKSWSAVTALEHVGMTVVGTSVKKSTEEDKQRIIKEKGADFHMWEDLKPKDMYRMLKDSQADIMLSGGRSQFVALKARTPWLDINQERHHAFAGYQGIVTLVERIDATINNPVWEEVRRPAPWDLAAL
jgi:nitrogenase molybdenum-cofactor synthesis protein NifE